MCRPLEIDYTKLTPEVFQVRIRVLGKSKHLSVRKKKHRQMVKKLEGQKKGGKGQSENYRFQVELAQVDSLTGTNNVLLSYVNVKIADLTAKTISPEKVQATWTHGNREF